MTRPFFMRRYDMQHAGTFLRASGFRLFAWGILVPVSRHGGIGIMWLRREKAQ